MSRIKPTYTTLISIFLGMAAVGSILAYSFSGDKNIFDNQAQVINFGTPELPKDYEIGAWVWSPPTKYNEEQMNELFSRAEAEGFNTLYVSIDEYADNKEISSRAEREAKIKEFIEAAKNFNRIASYYGINVHALAGHASHAEDSHHYMPLSIADFVLDFNSKATEEEKYKSIQFDIEPYALENYGDDPEGIWAQYLELVELLTEKIKESNTDIPLGFAVPFWADGANRSDTTVLWNSEEASVFAHMVEMLDSLKRSYIVIMDYRDRTDGADGSIALARQEFNHVQNTSSNVTLMIGQEASGELPDDVTFFGESKNNLKRAIARLQDAYANSGRLRGFVVNSLDAYMLLLE